MVNKKAKYDCPKCTARVMCLSTHLKAKHKDLSAEEASKILLSKSGIDWKTLRHKDKFPCPEEDCVRVLVNERNLAKHLKRMHGVEVEKKEEEDGEGAEKEKKVMGFRRRDFMCPAKECEKEFVGFETAVDLAIHCIQTHNGDKTQTGDFRIVEMYFSSRQEFDDWRCEYRKATATGIRNYRQTEYFKTYVCHRALSYSFKTKGRGIRQRKSKKTVKHCSCFATISPYSDGRVRVQTCLGHLGHEVPPHTAASAVKRRQEIFDKIVRFETNWFMTDRMREVRESIMCGEREKLEEDERDVIQCVGEMCAQTILNQFYEDNLHDMWPDLVNSIPSQKELDDVEAELTVLQSVVTDAIPMDDYDLLPPLHRRRSYTVTVKEVQEYYNQLEKMAKNKLSVKLRNAYFAGIQALPVRLSSEPDDLAIPIPEKKDSDSEEETDTDEEDSDVFLDECGNSDMEVDKGIDGGEDVVEVKPNPEILCRLRVRKTRKVFDEQEEDDAVEGYIRAMEAEDNFREMMKSMENEERSNATIDEAIASVLMPESKEKMDGKNMKLREVKMEVDEEEDYKNDVIPIKRAKVVPDTSNWHSCPRCSRSYATMAGVQQHLRRSHKNDVMDEEVEREQKAPVLDSLFLPKPNPFSVVPGFRFVPAPVGLINSLNNRDHHDHKSKEKEVGDRKNVKVTRTVVQPGSVLEDVPNKRYICSHCENFFSDASLFAHHHANRHGGCKNDCLNNKDCVRIIIRKFICRRCGEMEFATKKEMFAHHAQVHGTNTAPTVSSLYDRGPAPIPSLVRATLIPPRKQPVQYMNKWNAASGSSLMPGLGPKKDETIQGIPTPSMPDGTFWWNTLHPVSALQKAILTANPVVTPTSGQFGRQFGSKATPTSGRSSLANHQFGDWATPTFGDPSLSSHLGGLTTPISQATPTSGRSSWASLSGLVTPIGQAPPLSEQSPMASKFGLGPMKQATPTSRQSGHQYDSRTTPTSGQSSMTTLLSSLATPTSGNPSMSSHFGGLATPISQVTPTSGRSSMTTLLSSLATPTLNGGVPPTMSPMQQVMMLESAFKRPIVAPTNYLATPTDPFMGGPPF